MNVTRIEAAPQYHPPEHFDMRCLRLQGMEAGPSETFWMGMSEIAPGGHTSLSASPYEKLYLVVEGEIVVGTGDEEAVLHRLDSCRIAPGEARKLENRGQVPALIVLCMPLTEKKA
ncbi:cupin domain-containing protein [Aquamicrobium sp. LC103]|uniref:cupin domain-containing protein n=1 Tax=Aquamicrobium sp. LC103 TaxID=1120658 RepID=UPI00063EC450|nr:cupin domain-containing protein [Aquamicrobium sp. LC103]TKT69867.1 cupin domain-containing protein [Aquamicrobium sp. LC103]